MMLAENEERNPAALHMELGFPREANVITAVGAEGPKLYGSGLNQRLT